MTAPAFRLETPGEVQGSIPLPAGLPGIRRPPPLVFGQDDPPKELRIRTGSGTPEQNEAARAALIRAGQTDSMAAHLKPPGGKP